MININFILIITIGLDYLIMINFKKKISNLLNIISKVLNFKKSIIIT